VNYFLLGVLAVINIWAFAAFGVDKRRARLNKPRTPESTLLLLAAVGGAVGAWLAVRVFLHKNRKKSFLLPLVVASVVAVLAWYTVLDLLWQPRSAG
jgi:uncharacterized membrane protein YsdA (DUF1294 family)